MLAPKILGRKASHTRGSRRVLAFAEDGERIVVNGVDYATRSTQRGRFMR